MHSGFSKTTLVRFLSRALKGDISHLHCLNIAAHSLKTLAKTLPLALLYLFLPLLLLHFSHAPALVANIDMNLSASNGEADSQPGVWQGINLRGQQGNPTLINVRSALTLTGNGGASPLVSGAPNGVEFRVYGTTLKLGNATNSKGGVLDGNIVLDGSSILEARSAVGSGATSAWLLRAIGNTDGAISRTGKLRLHANGLLQTGAIGAEAEELHSITIQDNSRLIATDNLWTKNLVLKDDSAIVGRQGDINADALSLANASSISSSGDVTTGAIQSASSPTVVDMNSIQTEAGNITINGQINLQSGLLSLRSGGDININYDGAAITGAGELYLRALGNINGVESLHEKTSIEALRINSGSDVKAKDILAAQFTAQNAKITQDLTIKGDSVELFGQQVDYGLLNLSGNASEIGGNLDVADAKMTLGNARVGEDAYFNRIDGTFNNLIVKGNTVLDCGSLTGENLESSSMQIGGRQFTSNLKTTALQPGNLEAGQNAVIQTGSYISTGGNLILKNGASLVVEKGDIGSAEMPLGDIEIANVSSFHAPASIFAKSLAQSGSSQTVFSAASDIAIDGAIAGSESLSLQAGGKISSDSLLAGAVDAYELTTKGDAVIYSTGDKPAALKLSGPAAAINGEFYLSRGTLDIQDLNAGKDAVFLHSEGKFRNIDAASALYLEDSQLTGSKVSASDIWLAGNADNTLTAQKVSASNLFIYCKSVLSAEEYASSGGTVTLGEGGKLYITKGNLASENSRAGNIYVSGGSELNVAGSVFAKNLISYGGQNRAITGGDLNL